MRKASNPNHGWQTAGKNQLVCSTLGSRYHGFSCDKCVHYPGCKKAKNIPPKSDYCHWPSNIKRFEYKTSELPPIVRSTDPITSKKAAIRIDGSGARKSHIQKIYSALKNHPGRTFKELAPLTNLTESQVEKRLSDLKNENWIYQNGERNGCGLWWPKERRQAA